MVRSERDKQRVVNERREEKRREEKRREEKRREEKGREEKRREGKEEGSDLPNTNTTTPSAHRLHHGSRSVRLEETVNAFRSLGETSCDGSDLR
jgi:hypothetical protein